MFNGQDDNEAHITFSVNKNIVRAIDGTEDYVVVKAEAGDPHFTYVYDLNDYVGEKVTLSLASINNVNHCVFLKASLTETAI